VGTPLNAAERPLVQRTVFTPAGAFWSRPGYEMRKFGARVRRLGRGSAENRGVLKVRQWGGTGLHRAGGFAQWRYELEGVRGMAPVG